MKKIRAMMLSAAVVLSIALFGGGDAKAVGYFAEVQSFLLFVGQTGFSDTATWDYANMEWQLPFYRHRTHATNSEYFWHEWRLEYSGSWYATVLYVNNRVDDLTYLIENNVVD